MTIGRHFVYTLASARATAEPARRSLMRVKLRHLRHPLHTTKVVAARAASRWRVWRFVRNGDRDFAADPRYDLGSVRAGFTNHAYQHDDSALLERICAAYIKAAEAERRAGAVYRPTGWWEVHRQLSLKGVIDALAGRDISSLGRMYKNFYRDPCSAGLIFDQGLAKEYFGTTISDFHQRLYLIDALYRIDDWKEVTGGRYRLADLAGPSIGNPFGVVLDGTLVRVGAEYQHYCAARMADLLGSEHGGVVEIGGGFGGMAYYLLRDKPGTTYIDFDLPESIALASYYLIKAYPDLRVLLYGEQELTAERISQVDIVLMPVFELAKMPAKSVPIVFSAHAISDLSGEAMDEYLKQVARVTTESFACIGDSAAIQAMAGAVEARQPALKLKERRSLKRHQHRMRTVRHFDEIECVYQTA